MGHLGVQMSRNLNKGLDKVLENFTTTCLFCQILSRSLGIRILPYGHVHFTTPILLLSQISSNQAQSLKITSKQLVDYYYNFTKILEASLIVHCISLMSTIAIVPQEMGGIVFNFGVFVRTFNDVHFV